MVLIISNLGIKHGTYKCWYISYYKYFFLGSETFKEM